MVVRRDVEDLLQTGSWRTARADSPGPPEPRRHGRRPSRHDGQVPRTFRHSDFNGNRFPPRPRVEEEAVSLAREYSHSQGAATPEPTEEDPKHRGDIDQTPVILPVHEYNPERRFVLVPNLSDDDRTDGLDSLPQYDVNTCKKFVLVQPDNEASDCQSRRAEETQSNETRFDEDKASVSSTRSHTELPSIKKDLREAPAQPPSASHSAGQRKQQASVTVDQKPPSSGEYANRRHNAKAADSLLSPVTQHATHGRDQSYWDSNSGVKNRSRSGNERKDSKAVSEDRHSTYSSKSLAGGSRQPTTDKGLKHENLTRRGERRATERDERHAYPRERHRGDVRCSRTGISPPSPNQQEASHPQRGERKTSPSCPCISSASKGALPTKILSHRRRHQQPSRDGDEDSGCDDGPVQRSVPQATRSRGATVGHDDRAAHMVPDPSIQWQKPRASSPRGQLRLPTRRPSSDSDSGYTTRSAAVPPDGHKDAPYPTSDRESFQHDPSHVVMTTATPIIVAANSSGTATGSDRRRSPPMASKSHARQSVSSHDDPPPPKRHEQARVYEAERMKQTGDKSITSYRKYSEDVQQGLGSSLPDCSRVVPRAGYNDWLTLPRAENFVICPGCYGAVFANSPFQHAFVPAHRPLDKAVGCDFGTPPWYRIAYLMTLKYGYTDLRLLQGIAAVAARHQPCAGQRSVTRVWHGLLDPLHKRPILSFPVCHGCARTMEGLLPNLAGAFAPLDSPSEPSRGMCELRFAPDRKRFLAYFDLLETASDRALSRTAAPDLQYLANRVREISLLDECHRARPVPGRKWHVMQALPEFTVCEECFDEVVWPLIETEQGNDDNGGGGGGGNADKSQNGALGGGTGAVMARNFLPRTQQRPMAACQLYSERMREAFRQACWRNDFAYLEDVVRNRIQSEAWMRARLAQLQREAPEDSRVQEDIARVVREWKLVE